MRAGVSFYSLEESVTLKCIQSSNCWGIYNVSKSGYIMLTSRIWQAVENWFSNEKNRSTL